MRLRARVVDVDCILAYEIFIVQVPRGNLLVDTLLLISLRRPTKPYSVFLWAPFSKNALATKLLRSLIYCLSHICTLIHTVVQVRLVFFSPVFPLYTADFSYRQSGAESRASVVDSHQTSTFDGESRSKLWRNPPADSPSYHRSNSDNYRGKSCCALPGRRLARREKGARKADGAIVPRDGSAVPGRRETALAGKELVDL